MRHDKWDPIYLESEVRKRLKCSRATYYRIIEEGKLKRFRVRAGGSWRVRESDLNAYIRQMKEDAEKEE